MPTHTLGDQGPVVQYATQSSFNKIKGRCRQRVMRHAALQPAVALGAAGSLHPAILHDSGFLRFTATASRSEKCTRVSLFGHNRDGGGEAQ